MKKAFTLVELIVVITILWILSTVWFISFMWYSVTSRDSVRIANLSDLQKSLELRKTRAGEFPEPDNSYSVKYLWKEIWKQGTIWDKTKKHIKFQATEMDPKYTNDFSYSVSADGKTFEVGTIMEDESNNTFGFLWGNVYAAENEKALNFWSLVGKFQSVKINWETHVFSVPSMTLNSFKNTDNSDFWIVVDVASDNFSVTWESSIPESYVEQSESTQTTSFTPRLLYRGANCWVETDQDIVNFIATLRDSFNSEPYLSNPNYQEVFTDYEILRNNIDDFEQLKKLGLKINKLLWCNIKNFKTVDIFPTQCGYEWLDFEWVVDWFDIESKSCLFNYTWDGTAVVTDNIWNGNSKGLYINPVAWDGAFSYRVFTYKPFKMDYDFLSTMTPWGYYKLYINDVEYLTYSSNVTEFQNYQTPLLKPGLYDFKWVVHRHSSNWSHKWQLILDNLKFTCVWGGWLCGWTEWTLELWPSNPWDIYEFWGVVNSTWPQVTGVWNNPLDDDTYSIKAPVIPLWRSEATMSYKKTLLTDQKFHFDYKANLQYNWRFRFFINGIEYHTETWYMNNNNTQPFKTYDSPLLPAGEYEFKWVWYRYWGTYETNLWLDNFRFSCEWWWAGCGILNETFEEGNKDFSDINMTFWWDSDLPWNIVSWSNNVSQWNYALKSPTLEPYVPYGTTQHNMTINKTFSQPTKISFDLKNEVWGWYAEFFINWIEYYEQRWTDDYHNVESPLLPAGDYEFKWVVRRHWTGANTYIWLDNIKYICEWGWMNCGVIWDGSFEKWNNALWDINMYEFTWAVDTPWMIEDRLDYVSQGIHSLKSPSMKNHFDVTSMKMTKTLTENQSISFDMKTYLQSNGAYVKFKIWGLDYLYQTWHSTGNTTSWWNNYNSWPLPAGTYEIEWEVKKHSETNIWLDNITINN